MRVWALASHEFTETLDLFRTRGEAEDVLSEVLADEPEWRELLYVIAVDLDKTNTAPTLN